VSWGELHSKENSDVSVVILTRNSSRTIAQCLKSVSREKPGEIVVVDDQSTDETLEIVRAYGARLLINSTRSLGYGRQMAVRAAKGAYVMFLDSDAKLSRGCIATLRSEAERYGWVGIHAKVLSWENSSYWQRSVDETLFLSHNRFGPKAQIGSCGALFKRDLLLSHPFDPYFVESGEDVDVCRRLVEDNYSVGVSTASMYHLHRRGFCAFARQRYHYGFGLARLGVKYRERKRFFEPLITAFSHIVRDVFTKRARLVPFWFASGSVQFLGVLVGLSRIRRLRDSDSSDIRSMRRDSRIQ
jgi:glycosyltransferase involved in cell wall biosynthesis